MTTRYRCERTERGHWRLGVHIADVSYFVRPKTALDREAYARGTSVYLPDRVVPMLPEIISNGLASLQPDRVRYTKSVFIEFSPDGVPLHCEPMSAAIRSCRRFTYEEVDEYLADREAWRSKLSPAVFQLLSDMQELARMLRQRRLKRGSLELTMPEVKVDLDRDGQVSGAHVVLNTESHQIIEEFMLAANEAVAELLAKAELALLAPRAFRSRPAKAQGPHRIRHQPGASRRKPGEPLRNAAAAALPSLASRSSTPSTTPCCAACSVPSTVRRTKATTPWPANAIATSPRPFAVIPT